MRRQSTLMLAALAVALSAATPAYALPISIAATQSVTPTDSASSTTTPTAAQVSAAEARALELEKELADLEGESVAIGERIAVTSLRIYLQQREVDQAHMKLDRARAMYLDRVVALYKSGTSPLVLLFDSADLTEFVNRVTWLSRLADIDRRIYDDAIVEAAEADFQASQLENLRAQDVELRHLQDERLDRTTQLLAEQELLVAQLDARAKAALLEARQLAAKERKAWLDSSIPITQKVPVENATVEPYLGQLWKVAYYQPKLYRATGVKFAAVCSWYGNEFHGRRTASGQIFNQEDLTCASRTLPFGTRLALTRDDKHIIVVVNDRGPFINGRDLDLSRAAARLLGFSGVEPVQAEIVEPK